MATVASTRLTLTTTPEEDLLRETEDDNGNRSDRISLHSDSHSSSTTTLPVWTHSRHIGGDRRKPPELGRRRAGTRTRASDGTLSIIFKLIRLCLAGLLSLLSSVRRLPKWTLFIRGLFLFQLTTQAYVSAWRLVPWFLEDSSLVSTRLLQLLMLYLVAIMLCNWVCVIRYSSEYTGRGDVTTSNGFGGNQSPWQQQRRFALDSFPPQGGHMTVDVSEKGGLPWGRCEWCQLDVPPRTVHCRFCGVCVLRRDHHCHLVGSCIGHWNQRFFVAMAANGMMLGCLGAYLTLNFLWDHHDPRGGSLWNYFLPVTVVNWVWGSVSGLHTLLTFHAFMLCLFGPIAGHYFATQTCLIASGRTKREVQRRLKVTVTSSLCANLRLVFGPCWWLGLVLPLPHLFFPQTHQGVCYDNVKMLPD